MNPMSSTQFDAVKDDYRAYLLLERNLSENTLTAYFEDLARFAQWIMPVCPPHQAMPEHIEEFVDTLAQCELAPKSHARIISGVKAFFRFLQIHGIRPDNPTANIASPTLPKNIPDVLSIDEVNNMISAADTSTVLGLRNRAIIEMLYGSGLRVSELTNLEHRRMFLDKKILVVHGKGNKERLVPMSDPAVDAVKEYLAAMQLGGAPIAPGYEDYVFLSRRGKRLTRVMMFYVVRDLASLAGISKIISPHTLRHTFATHLLEGGANLRAIQMMLGHESISTTEIYLKIDTRMLREEILTHHPRNIKSV